MKATGIVRRIDDLGRVVIPKEIRRTLRIREGDPLEIYTEKDGSVIFRKYSPMGDLQEMAVQLCEAMSQGAGLISAVSDRDGVIAVSGASKRELMDKSNSEALEKLIESRRFYRFAVDSGEIPVTADSHRYRIEAAAPIITQGDLIGCAMVLAETGAPPAGEDSLPLVRTAAQFLGQQLES